MRRVKIIGWTSFAIGFLGCLGLGINTAITNNLFIFDHMVSVLFVSVFTSLLLLGFSTLVIYFGIYGCLKIIDIYTSYYRPIHQPHPPSSFSGKNTPPPPAAA